MSTFQLVNLPGSIYTTLYCCICLLLHKPLRKTVKGISARNSYKLNNSPSKPERVAFWKRRNGRSKGGRTSKKFICLSEKYGMIFNQSILHVLNFIFENSMKKKILTNISMKIFSKIFDSFF